MKYKHFGEMIRALRLAKGIRSHEDLVVLSGGEISAVTLGRIERGESPRVRPNTIQAIAKGLSMDPAKLASMIAEVGHPLMFLPISSDVKKKPEKKTAI